MVTNNPGPTKGPHGSAMAALPPAAAPYAAVIASLIPAVVDGVTSSLLERLPSLLAVEGDRLAYDLDQLAAATSLSRRTLESYVADGTLSATRVGRRLVVSPESARAFLRSFHRSSRGVA